jgi:hypothetical protein
MKTSQTIVMTMILQISGFIIHLTATSFSLRSTGTEIAANCRWKLNQSALGVEMKIVMAVAAILSFNSLVQADTQAKPVAQEPFSAKSFHAQTWNILCDGGNL